MSIARHRVATLALIAALTAPLAVLVVVWFHALDVPYLDDWEWTPMIAALRGGHVPWAQMWQLHNDHRNIVPDLLALALALDGEWNVRRQAIFDVGLAVLTQAVWYGVVQRVVARANRPLAFLAIVLLVFSLGQAENWIWGFQIAWFFANLSIAVAALAMTYRAQPRWNALALGAALVAAHSIAYGIDLLLAGCAVALLARKRAPSEIAAWLTATTVVVLWYVHDFTPGVYVPPATTGLARGFATVVYAVMVVGGPLTLAGTAAAFGAGLAGCGLWGYAAFAYAAGRRRGDERVAVLLVPLALGAVALLSALQIGYGRLFQGYPSALASRYVTVSSLLWIGLVLAYACGAVPVVAALRRYPLLRPGGIVLALAVWIAAQAGGYVALHERTLDVFAAGQVIPRYAAAPEDELHAIWPGEAYASELEAIRDGPFSLPNRRP